MTRPQAPNDRPAIPEGVVLSPREILAKAYRDNGDIGAANYIEGGSDLRPDTQIHLLAIADALALATPPSIQTDLVERLRELRKVAAWLDTLDGQEVEAYEAYPHIERIKAILAALASTDEGGQAG